MKMQKQYNIQIEKALFTSTEKLIALNEQIYLSKGLCSLINRDLASDSNHDDNVSCALEVVISRLGSVWDEINKIISDSRDVLTFDSSFFDKAKKWTSDSNP